MGEKAAPTKQLCRHIEEGVEMLSRERLDVCQNKSFQLSVSQLWLFSDITLILILPLHWLLLVCPHYLFSFFYADNSFPYSTWNNIKNTIQKNCWAVIHVVK